MIYFVRHGSTDWNDNINSQGKKDPRCQGRVDIPLNANGVEEAKVTAEKLKDVAFDRIICSPLTRAVQTCEIICKDKSQIEIDFRLIERDFGEFEGLSRHDFDFHSFCNINNKKQYQNVEPLKDVKKRIYDFIEELKLTPEKNVLIVSHGGVGCVFASYFKGIPEDGDLSHLEIPHGKPVCFDFNQ